jgi:hypothetical protein
MKSLRFGLVTALGHFWASGFVRPVSGSGPAAADAYQLKEAVWPSRR